MWAAPGAAVLVIALFFLRLYLRGLQFFHGDTQALVYPLKELVASALASGRLPLWDPYALCGHPVLPSYIAGVFLPENLLFLLLPFNEAFKTFVVSKHLLAALFQYALLRRLGAAPVAAACGGVLFALSGPFLSISPLLAFSYECIPLAAAAALAVAERPARPPTFLLAALAWTYVLFHGDLQAAVAGAVLALAFTAYHPPPHRRVALRRVAAAGVAGMALAAVQILPSALLLLESDRFALPGSERMHHSVSFAGLRHLLLPSDPVRAAYGDDFVAWRYLGFIACALALCGAAFGLRRNGARRRIVVVLLAAALAGIALALGRNAGVLDALQTLLPPLRVFRYPDKWLGVTAFAVAGLAALGLDELRRRGAVRPAAVLAVLAVLDVMIAGSPFLSERLVKDAAYDRRHLLRPDAEVHGFRPEDRILRFPPSGLFAGLRPGLAPAGAGPPDLAERTRIAAWNQRTLLGNAGSRAGVRRVSGIDSVRSPAFEALWRRAGEVGNPARAADICAARWVLSPPGAQDQARANPALRALFGGGEPVRVESELGALLFWKRPQAPPRARIVEEARYARGIEEALEVLFSAGFDPRHEVVLLREGGGEEPREPAGSRPAARAAGDPTRGPGESAEPPPHVAFAEDGEDRVVLEITPPARSGYLVLADTYARGWRAYAGGRELQVFQADCIGRAVELPPGAERVEFVYTPPGLEAGALISAATALALVGFVVLERLRR